MKLSYYNQTAIAVSIALSAGCLYSMEKPNTKQSTSVAMIRNIISGAGAGIVEVGFLGHILSYIINQKISCSNKMPLLPRNWGKAGFISLRPRHVYKGLGVNMASMAPITALQNSGSEEIQHLLRTAKGSELTDIEKIAPPVLAGAGAGYLVATPTEYLPNYMQRMSTEQNRQLSTKTATLELIRMYGKRALLRGGVATGTRDGIFTAGYKVLPYLIAKPLHNLIGDTQYTRMPASILAGVITALATQPAHVIARYLQNNPAVKHSGAALMRIIQKSEMRGLWAGALPRGARVTVAIPVLSEVEQQIAQLLK